MKRILVIGAVIAIIVLLLIYLRQTEYVSVKVSKVKRQDFSVTVTSTQTGTVKTEQIYHISSERTGKVLKVSFDEGDSVKKGDLLVELDTEELRFKKESLLRRIEAKEKETQALRFLIQAMQREINAETERARAVLDEAETRWSRYRRLYEKGYISELNLKEAERLYKVAKNSYEKTLAAKSRLRAKEEELKSAVQLLSSLKAELGIVEKELRDSYIRTPVDGIILSRVVEPGDTVTIGRVIGSIAVTAKLYVEAKVDEADIYRVKKGQEANILMDAYPDRVFKGRVIFISPVVTGKRLEARTFVVKVSFLNPPPTLKPGMSADVEIITGRVEDAVVVPTQAVIEDGQRRLVYVIKKGKALLKEVKTGLFSWTMTEILSGLQEGELIIINPDVPGLHDGARVKLSDQRSELPM
jgi:RND family efflux transporter MFP subunit